VDTTVSFPADSVRIVSSVNSLSEIPTVKKGERATLSISRLGEIITADCKAEALEAKIRLLNKEIEHFREVKTDRSETVIVPERFVPWTVKYLAWIGGIFLLFHGIKLILKFYNPFSR